MEQPEGAAEELCARAAYVWTEAEYSKSIRHHHGITPSRTLGPSVTVFVSVFAVLLSNLSLWLMVVTHFTEWQPAVISSMYTAWWLWAQQFKTQRERRCFLGDAAANLELHRKFVGNGMVQAVIHSGAEVKRENLSRMEWKSFSKICETSEGFLLYLYPKNKLLWQPNSSFASPQDIETFKQLAQAKGVRFTKGRS